MKAVLAALFLVMVLQEAHGQAAPASRTPPAGQPRNPAPPLGDESAEERQRNRIIADAVSDRLNRLTQDRWSRWTYAVCVGCGGPEPKDAKPVVTNPLRVLAGIPAYIDDLPPAQRAHELCATLGRSSPACLAEQRAFRPSYGRVRTARRRACLVRMSRTSYAGAAGPKTARRICGRPRSTF